MSTCVTAACAATYTGTEHASGTVHVDTLTHGEYVWEYAKLPRTGFPPRLVGNSDGSHSTSRWTVHMSQLLVVA